MITLNDKRYSFQYEFRCKDSVQFVILILAQERSDALLKGEVTTYFDKQELSNFIQTHVLDLLICCCVGKMRFQLSGNGNVFILKSSYGGKKYTPHADKRVRHQMSTR